MLASTAIEVAFYDPFVRMNANYIPFWGTKYIQPKTSVKDWPLNRGRDPVVALYLTWDHKEAGGQAAAAAADPMYRV